MEKIIFDEVIHPVVKFLTRHIMKHVGYVVCTTQRVINMRNKMKDLEKTSVDVQKHMDSNNINDKEIPTGVPDWLTEVENVKKIVESISSDGIGCLNMKVRYRTGRNASKATETIEQLITKNSRCTWTNAPKATGRVDPKPASYTSSTPTSSGGDGFKSREKPFNDALKFLQEDDNKSQVIALCGMGGVGKTTMMEQLKTVANDKKMFDWIVKVVIGRNPNMLSVQNDIALSLGGEGLQEATRTARAESLCRKFTKILEDNKEKVLVILDDVWQKLKLEDIGLTSPLGKGVKLLLTSRDSNICRQIAVDVVSDLQEVHINVLEEAEAINFFSQFTRVYKEDDHDWYQLGCDIVKKCGCLPLAIKLIGTTLNSQEDYVWRSTLQRLNKNNIDEEVQEVIKISYENIRKEEDKEILLFCGLFPEDADIPIEHLTRYAWGLKLFKEASTLGDARVMTKTCVKNIINANLLMHSDKSGCVKMHDLVLAFVLSRVARGNQPWIINHGDLYKWEVNESSKKISLTCKGMTEFPKHFKFPNLTFIQLMHGDLSLKFSDDFYENMEKVEVIAYFNMKYPLLPRSLQCSANLKTLILHECTVMFDCSFIGDLVNLEVLSFAHCGIRKLPSTIGNLTKLKLLDLTGCVDLHIDDGVFKNLDNLEELYMRSISYGKAIRFTNVNCEELKRISKQLCALEVEFHENKTLMGNLSLTKLDKFKISVGCMLDSEMESERYSYKNTLMLRTNHRSDVWDCKINELFKKTEKLHLLVEDMLGLGDIVSMHPYEFCNLRKLKVSSCADLKYLFPIVVASGLRNLKDLKVSSCPVLEALVYNDGSEINTEGDQMIRFEKLKYLSLERLPKLVTLFPVEYIVELPQLVYLEVNGLTSITSIYPDKNKDYVLLNSQVHLGKLKKLAIRHMEKLEQICSCDDEVINISMLREMLVYQCDGLVNLFPTNPMRLLNHLEILRVISCGSIEAIFNIDLGCVDKDEQLSGSRLRSIEVRDLWNLREVWRIKLGGENNDDSSLLIHGFEAVESISIDNCKRFRNVFTPTNIEFDLRALVGISIEFDTWMSRNEESEIDDNISTVAFPSSIIMRSFNYLDDLYLRSYNGVEVVFEIESSRELVTTTTYNQQQPLLPNLQRLVLQTMERMSHVWKGSKFTILQNQSSFRNLTTICLEKCKRIKYLFSPHMAKLLSNLKEIEVRECDGMEEIVSNRDDEDEDEDDEMTTTFFPHLHLLKFERLKNLKRIGGDDFKCPSVVSYYAVHMQKLQVMEVRSCASLTELFETPWIHNNNYSFGDGGMDTVAVIPKKLENIYVPQLSNLKKLVITNCDLLQHVFTLSTLVSLRKLEELWIMSCKTMKVIVKQENEDETTTSSKVVVFPRLKSVILFSLPSLESFSLGKNDFQWPLLEKAEIKKCPRMTMFTHSAELMEVFETQGIKDNSGTSQTIPRKENISMPLVFSVKKLVIASCNLLKHVFTFSTLESLRQLEELKIVKCKAMEVIVKKENEEQGKVVEFPRLKSLILSDLPNLKFFFLGINEFRWPLLEETVFKNCPKMMGFTSGLSTTPKLKYIRTNLGKHSLECGLNVHQTWLPCLESTSLSSTTLEQLPPWSFHNLIELCMDNDDDDDDDDDYDYDYYYNYYYCYEDDDDDDEDHNDDSDDVDDNDFKCIIPSRLLLLLQKLERIRLHNSRGEGVFEVEEMEGTNSESETYIVEIPNLTQMELKRLHTLKYIWKSNHHQRTVVLIPNLTTLSIDYCPQLKHALTTTMVRSLQQLQQLHISQCHNMDVIVRVEEEESEIEVLNFPNLTTLIIDGCHILKHVFTSSMVGSLQQLQELHISRCQNMEVIVKVEEESETESECDAKMKEIVTFPCLKSLKLEKLESLEGFCLGKDDFSWPSLATLEIKECHALTIFTKGQLATPTLNTVDTSFGRCNMKGDLNSFIKTNQHEGFKF